MSETFAGKHEDLKFILLLVVAVHLFQLLGNIEQQPPSSKKKWFS